MDLDKLILQKQNEAMHQNTLGSYSGRNRTSGGSFR